MDRKKDGVYNRLETEEGPIREPDGRCESLGTMLKASVGIRNRMEREQKEEANTRYVEFFLSYKGKRIDLTLPD